MENELLRLTAMNERFEQVVYILYKTQKNFPALFPFFNFCCIIELTSISPHELQIIIILNHEENKTITKVKYNKHPKNLNYMDLLSVPGQQGLKYFVDVVMCIDCTGSMHGILNTVKNNALKFYPDLVKACKDKNKNISQFRVKVIAFRDFNADEEKGMDETEFFYLPSEEGKFKTYVSSLVADGGGDEPENGLEAVSLAIQSDWTTGGDRRRHIIVVWTDASAHPLESDLTKNEFYPDDMPADFDEFYDLWQDEEASLMEETSKRLLIFAPDAYPWTDMEGFDLVIHHPAKAGQGLTELDYQTILNSIVNSI